VCVCVCVSEWESERALAHSISGGWGGERELIWSGHQKSWSHYGGPTAALGAPSPSTLLFYSWPLAAPPRRRPSPPVPIVARLPTMCAAPCNKAARGNAFAARTFEVFTIFAPKLRRVSFLRRGRVGRLRNSKKLPASLLTPVSSCLGKLF